MTAAHRFWLLFGLLCAVIVVEGALAMYVLRDFSRSVARLQRMETAGMQIDEFGVMLNNFVMQMKVSTAIAPGELGVGALPATGGLERQAAALGLLNTEMRSDPLERLIAGVAALRTAVAGYAALVEAGDADAAALDYIQTIEPLADRLLAEGFPATRSAVLAEVERVSQSYQQSGVYAWRVLAATLVSALAAGLFLGRLIWATLRTSVRQEQQLERHAAALAASLAEKELLLKEIHHRVKNNLQVITSLLKLESEAVTDPRALRSFQDSLARVRSMALLHEKLYRSHDLAAVDLGDYLRQLAMTLCEHTGTDSSRVRVAFQLEPVSVSTDTAAPCGLIANELISNVLKHAFPGTRAGEILIGLRRQAPDALQLIVADDGIGLPPDLDVRNTDTLGLQLVALLVDQVHGTLRVERTAGTRFEVTWPETPARH
jgi:two-component sensor histidine kinase